MELNRRDFLKGALVAGAAAAGASMVGCSPTNDGDANAVSDANGMQYPDGLTAQDFEASAAELAPITEFAEEKTYDVVVVGAGTGGALRA